MVGIADLLKAIATAWTQSSLNSMFQSYWSSGTTEFVVLNDQEAPGGQPFPYVVMDQTSDNVVSKMTKGTKKYEIRDVEVRFNLHVREVDGNTSTDKEIAASLAEEVMGVFGGHPTTSPTGTITLDHGNHLITTYQNGFCIRTGEGFCQWVLVYTFRIDTPVAI